MKIILSLSFILIVYLVLPGTIRAQSDLTEGKKLNPPNGEVNSHHSRFNVANLGCGANFSSFGLETNCYLFAHISSSLSIGLRQSQGYAYIADASCEATLGTLSFRPFKGTFHADFAVGQGKIVEKRRVNFSPSGENISPTIEDSARGIAWDFRFGNRWTLPIGLQLGLTYLGFQSIAAKGGILLLGGVEIGWIF